MYFDPSDETTTTTTAVNLSRSINGDNAEFYIFLMTMIILVESTMRFRNIMKLISMSITGQ